MACEFSLFALSPYQPANNYWLDHWGAREGFPEETILSITQTSDGFLWLSTPAGVIRFDGREFIYFDGNRIPGLQIVRTESVLAAPDGTLWLRNSQGLLWRYRNGLFEKFTGDGQRSFSPIRWLRRDAKQRIWIVTDDRVHLWVNGKIQWDFLSLAGWQGRVLNCFVDSRSRLWLALKDGAVVRLTPAGQPDLHLPASLAIGGTLPFMLDESRGDQWFASNKGMLHLEARGTEPVLPAAAALGPIGRFCIDQNDAIWLTSAQGLGRLYRGEFLNIFPNEDLRDSSVMSMFIDREGSLWLGTVRRGLFRIKDSKFGNLTTEEGLSSNQVYAAYRDSAGFLWVGTDKGLDRRAPTGAITHFGARNGLPGGSIFAIAEDHRGRIWAGGDHGLAIQSGDLHFSSRPLPGEPEPYVRALAGSLGGGMWVATRESLAEMNGARWTPIAPKYNLTPGVIRTLHDSRRYGLLVTGWRSGILSCGQEGCRPIRGAEPGTSLTAFAIHEDAAGTLWVVSSRGLGRVLPPQSGELPSIAWYNLARWLPNPELEFYQIAEDSQGWLWLASRRCLVRVQKVSPEQLSPRSVRQFDLRDGMRSANFGVARQGYRAPESGGVLWFPSLIGLVAVDPRHLRDNPLPPPVRIEKVVVDGSSVDWRNRAMLPAGVERIEVTFIAPSLVEPRKVRYRYRLEGFDQQWVEAGGLNTALYTRPGKGHYRFHVMACNNDGVWNQEGDTIEFSIAPHVYEQPGFYVLAAMALLIAGALALRARTRSLRCRNLELEHRVAERTAELERARSDAEAGARAKADFLATMSHEIRTPMNGVLGMLSLLEQTDLSGQQRTYTEVISSSSQSLLAILNDVLELSRIEAGKLALSYRPVNVRYLAEQVIELFRHAAAEKGIRVSFATSAQLPEWFSADEARIRQVLVNLVGNAVKFTEQGSIQFSLTASRLDGNRWQLEFAVRDTGIGIAPNQAAGLFQKFSQADSSAARKYGGSGLGLAISKSLAEHMRGGIDLESALGAGSCFRFRVPLEAVDPPSPRLAEHALAPIPDGAGCCILLAEDNQVNVKVAAAMLTRLGHTVAQASNGREVLEAFDKKSFDLVLMDCQMPELDGFEATRRLRERFPANGPIIIAMTANAMEGDRERCLAAGMDDYLAKPVVFEHLAACIHRWSNRKTPSGS